ncbi:hypothetical protein DR864_12160 [Runella rosea]|uniref:Immunity protein 43 domain-containing protein n=1 Tax=Runella rosea TaxID=2259595 RepID=A0A344TII1_9BACT|nr:hypothetical protein [Runella rosea]AXE18452.1 hypothetical protein DR864_12160 [Runella rosea]
MEIYQVTTNLDYQWVLPQIEESELLNLMDLNCYPKSKSWPNIDWYIYNPKKKKGNFFTTGSGGSFAFDEEVLNSDLFSLIEMAGEVLPIKLEDNTNLYILNVLKCINPLNQKKTKWQLYEDGSKGRILDYSFHTNRFSESSLFKIPETSKIEILTYSGIKGDEDEFKSLYEYLGFTGLEFKQIYTDSMAE